MTTLVHALAGRVDAAPGAPALVAGDRRVTYATLWRDAGRVARTLADRGVAAGDRVALVVRSSPDYAAASYGAWAAGAVAVPLNTEAKASDLAAWIAHSGARVVIADRAHPERLALIALAGDTISVLTVDDALAAPPLSVDPDMAARDGRDTLAVILYTSGTTGDPKGVMLSHGNLAANTAAIVDYLGLGPDDRVLAALPFFYSYGSSVLHSHLWAGGTAVVEPGLMYPQHVVDAMRRERVTGFPGVPWMFTTLLDRTAFGRMRGELPSLRYFTQAGAAMAPAEIGRVRAAFPDVDFFVMYGQTEATARLTYLAPSEIDRRLGSVGRPLAGVTVEVRREDGTVAAPGESGELFAAGPNVMLGYWRAPDATQRAIVEDARGRWLRTGDLGHADDDGFLYLTGRRAEIIKTGAHRVSPLEVEDVVRRLDGVADAAAFGVPDPGLGEAIHVAVVPGPGARLAERDVQAHCRRHLSLYKLPRRVIFVPTLPRTTSGKIRRRMLAAQAEVTT